MAEGYAINHVGADGKGILIDTISTSRRGTLVNWLVSEMRMKVTIAWTDDMIETAWQSMRSPGIYCIKVDVHASQGVDANVTGRP